MQKLRLLLLCLLGNTLSATIAQQNLPTVGASQEPTAYQETAECLNKRFKTYAPPLEMQDILNNLFEPDFFQTLEKQDDPIAWLKSKGFKPLQFKKELPFMAVVVESEKLPGYVIKFMRITAPVKRVKKSANVHRSSVRLIPKISNRVVHAQEVAKKINHLHLVTVHVPDKYFYCIDNIALVIAKKVVPSGRTLKDISQLELIEILSLVSAAKGILDLRPRNMLLTDDAIFFIDTEKEKYADWWVNTKIKDLARFKAAVNPAYGPLIDAWAAKQDKKGNMYHLLKKATISRDLSVAAAN